MSFTSAETSSDSKDYETHPKDILILPQPTVIRITRASIACPQKAHVRSQSKDARLEPMPSANPMRH